MKVKGLRIIEHPIYGVVYLPHQVNSDYNETAGF